MIWLRLALLVLAGPLASRVEAGTLTNSFYESARPNTNEDSSLAGSQCGSCTLEALNPQILSYPVTFSPPSLSLVITQTVIKIITYNAGSTSIGESFETLSVTVEEGTELFTPPSWFTFGTWL